MTLPCVLWTKHIDKTTGYGRVGVGGKVRGAHVVAWESVNGPVPAGMVLHHRCETKACVEPSHLTPMTQSAHMAMHSTGGTTVCRRGHPKAALTRCRICARASQARYRRKKGMAVRVFKESR